MCHTDRDLVEGLVRRVRASHPGAVVLLRHDRGPEFIDEGSARRWGAELLLSPVRVTWGGWTMVAAMLEAFEYARKILDPDYLVLISGHDVPVRPLSQWADAVVADGTDALLAPADETQKLRYTHRWRQLRSRSWPSPLSRAARIVWWRVGFRVQRSVILDTLPRGNGWVVGRRRLRPFAYSADYVQASQWMTLSRKLSDQFSKRMRGTRRDVLRSLRPASPTRRTCRAF